MIFISLCLIGILTGLKLFTNSYKHAICLRFNGLWCSHIQRISSISNRSSTLLATMLSLSRSFSKWNKFFGPLRVREFTYSPKKLFFTFWRFDGDWWNVFMALFCFSKRR